MYVYTRISIKIGRILSSIRPNFIFESEFLQRYEILFEIKCNQISTLRIAQFVTFISWLFRVRLDVKFGLEREKKIDGARKIEEAKLRRDMLERDLSFTRRNDSYSRGRWISALAKLYRFCQRTFALFLDRKKSLVFCFHYFASNEFHRKCSTIR